MTSLQQEWPPTSPQQGQPPATAQNWQAAPPPPQAWPAPLQESPVAHPPQTVAGQPPTGQELSSAPIATLPPLEDRPRDQSPIDVRTGEPQRPLLIWAAASLPFVGTVIVAVAIGLVMWNSIPNFAEASWINGRMPTDPGSWVRVAFSVINAMVAVLVGGSAAFLGYNIFTGRDWTRIGGIITAVLSFASLLLTPLAAISVIPIAVGAGLTWLPGCRRFFNAWSAHRRGSSGGLTAPERVYYGPLPRYR